MKPSTLSDKVITGLAIAIFIVALAVLSAPVVWLWRWALGWL